MNKKRRNIVFPKDSVVQPRNRNLIGDWLDWNSSLKSDVENLI